MTTPRLEDQTFQGLLADLPWWNPAHMVRPDFETPESAAAWREYAVDIGGRGRDWWLVVYEQFVAALSKPQCDGGLSQSDAGILREWCRGVNGPEMPTPVRNVLTALGKVLEARFYGWDLQLGSQGSLGQNWFEENSK